MNWLTQRLKLVQRTAAQDEYELRHARYIASRASYDYLRRRSSEGLISEHTWQRLAPIMQRQSEALVEAVKQVMTSEPAVEAEELDTARREVLRAQRAALVGLLRDGVITEENYSELVNEVDEALTGDHFIWPELAQGRSASLQVTRLMAAIVQRSDLNSASQALSEHGFQTIHLPSSGGFLGFGNETLLVGLNDGSEAEVVEVLRQSCQGRVDYPAEPLPDVHGIKTTPTPLTIGGVTIFTFEVEDWEQF